MIAAWTGKTDAASVLQTRRMELKSLMESFEEIGTEEGTVAEEKALRFHCRGKSDGHLIELEEVIFHHQGILYRISAFGPQNDAEWLRKSLIELLKGFRFLGDRKEWVEAFEGKPAPVALRGGLDRFDLNRPRWQETTLDSAREYDTLETLFFEFFPGAAWLIVRLREPQRSTAAELDARVQFRSRQLKNFRSVENKVGDLPYAGITYDSTGGSSVVRLAVLCRDGIAVEVIQECHPFKVRLTERDWIQILTSLRLQSQTTPEAPLLFPVGYTFSSRRQDPGLATFLSRARHALPSAEERTLLDVARDGGRALVLLGSEVAVLNLDSQKSRFVAIPYQSPCVWSPDGLRIAGRNAKDQTAVPDLESGGARGFQGKPSSLSFGPDGTLLPAADAGEKAQPFVVGKLERIQLRDGERSTLLDDPLARVRLPVSSPDGRRLALVCNRDCPRTQSLGGNLFVAAYDGKELRRLTEGNENYSSVCWSPDGKALYAVRRRWIGPERL